MIVEVDGVVEILGHWPIIALASWPYNPALCGLCCMYVVCMFVCVYVYLCTSWYGDKQCVLAMVPMDMVW